MCKIFINEVVKYALIIGVSVIALVWAALSRSTMTTLENYLQSSVNLIEFDRKQHQVIIEDYKANSIAITSNIALLVKAEPKYLKDQQMLDNLRKSYRLDEILITDENSQVAAYSSFNNNTKTSCVHTDKFDISTYLTEYVKYIDPVYCDRYKTIMQYTGVARKDKPGIIITSKRSENIAGIIKSKIVNDISSLYPIYRNGFIAIIDKDTHTIVSYKDGRYLGVDIKELGIDIYMLRNAT